MVLVLSKGVETPKKHWEDFFSNPLISQYLKGGSALDRARRYSNGEYESAESEINGYLLFRTDDEDVLKKILDLIPVAKSGGKILVYRLVEDA